MITYWRNDRAGIQTPECLDSSPEPLATGLDCLGKATIIKRQLRDLGTLHILKGTKMEEGDLIKANGTFA